MTDTAVLAAAIADRYTLDRELGRGGMATVYLARDVRHDRLVALKVLHAELGAVLGAERFLTEIRTTANLQHPNILPLFDSGAAAGLVFYVMPYVTGETLRDRLAREGQLSVNESVRITRGIAAALDYAHRQGVVHRDIRPENILLQDGQPLVADFGIALAVSNAGGARITQTGLSVGTPAYMSPEQAAAERQLDGRSDQYSLASVLYELLAGEPPFTGASAASVMSKLMTEVPRRIDVLRPAVPASLADAVARALEKLPADRHETVAQFAEALASDGATGYRTGDRVARAVTTDGPWKRRAIVIGVVGVASVAAALFVPRGTAPSSVMSTASVDAPRFYSIALPDTLPMVSAADVFGVRPRGLDISPDGQRLVYTTVGASASRLAMIDLATGTARVLAGTDSALLPTISPASDDVVFVRERNTGSTELWRMSFESLVPTLQQRLKGTVQSMAWHMSGPLFMMRLSNCLTSLSIGGTAAVRMDSTVCGGAVPSAARTLPGVLALNRGRSIVLFDVTHRTVREVRMRGDTGTTLTGASAMLVQGRILVFTRDSSLLAARIDTASGLLESEPRVVLTGVRSEAFSQDAPLSLTANGTLVWVTGGAAERTALVRVAPGGKVLDTVAISDQPVSSLALSADAQALAYSTGTVGDATAMVLVNLRSGVREVLPLAQSIEPNELLGNGLSRMLAIAGSGSTRLISVNGSQISVDTARLQPNGESPDGRWRCRTSLYWRTDSPQDTVRVVPLAGSGQCRFSPDGNWLMIRNDQGVYLTPAANATRASTRLLSTRGDFDEPRWTADSRSLIGRAGDTWYRMRINAQGTLLGQEEVYVSGVYAQAQSSFAVFPDGNLLLITAPPPVRATRINVLTNFPLFLEERLKR